MDIFFCFLDFDQNKIDLYLGVQYLMADNLNLFLVEFSILS